MVFKRKKVLQGPDEEVLERPLPYPVVQSCSAARPWVQLTSEHEGPNSTGSCQPDSHAGRLPAPAEAPPHGVDLTSLFREKY